MDAGEGMDAIEAIRARRSIKRFTERRPTREEIEGLLEVAALAPNHRMTQPWRFYVMGPETQKVYAELKGHLKSQKVDDPSAAVAVKDKVARDTIAIPVILAVAMKQDEDPLTREEDHAATFMGIENLMVAAAAAGLGCYLHTGRIMERDRLREILGVAEDERVVAIIDVGEPAEVPGPKARTPASELTTWTD